MSDYENNSDQENSLEVIEKPKKKISDRQRKAGIENLKKGPKSRETKILNNNNYSINPYLEFEKLLNPNVEIKNETPKEEVKKEIKTNTHDNIKYLKELEKKIDLIANINLETNKRVNKMYEIKKAKAQAKIEIATTKNNTTTNTNTNTNNDLYARLANKIEQKIKKNI